MSIYPTINSGFTVYLELKDAFVVNTSPTFERKLISLHLIDPCSIT